MAKGYELLADGGCLSYIVPNAWLGIRGGKSLREFLLSKQALENVVVYDCNVFDAPSVEAVSFKARKASSHSHLKVFHTTSPSTIPSQESFEIAASVCLARPDCTIPVVWTKNATSVFSKLYSNAPALGDQRSGFAPLIALQAYARGKGKPPQSAADVKNHVFHRLLREDENTHPYLDGSDVFRYGYSTPRKFLKHGPWLAEPQSLDRFSGPRVLVREIISPPPYLLSACAISDTCLYNKSVLHILSDCTEDDDLSENRVRALLAILNSKLASFIIRLRGRKSQRRLFPKIVGDDLKDFPLPLRFPECTEELSSLASSMEELAAAAGENGYAADCEKLQLEIDAAVFRAYDLGDSHISTVEAVLV